MHPECIFACLGPAERYRTLILSSSIRPFNTIKLYGLCLNIMHPALILEKNIFLCSTSLFFLYIIYPIVINLLAKCGAFCIVVLPFQLLVVVWTDVWWDA